MTEVDDYAALPDAKPAADDYADLPDAQSYDDLPTVNPARARSYHATDSAQPTAETTVMHGEPESVVGGVWRQVNTPLVEGAPPAEEVERVAKSGTPLERKAMGVRLGVDQFLSGLTSPLGLATVGLSRFPLAGKAMAVAFGAPMLKEAAVDIPKAIGEEMGKPENERDLTKLYALWTQEAVNTGMGAGLSASVAHPSAAPIVENLKEAKAPATAAAIQETIADTAPKETIPVEPESNKVKPTTDESPLVSASEPAKVEQGQTDLPSAGEQATEVAQVPPTDQRPVSPAPNDAPKEGEIVGMGGATAEEFKPAQPAIKDLADATEKLPEQPASPREAFDVGRSLANIKDGITDTLEGLKSAGDYLKQRLIGAPQWTDLKAAIGDRHLSLTESVKNAEAWVKDAKKRVPDRLTQEAISNWVDTGGDAALLDKAFNETPERYKSGYEAAKNLTPEQVEFAKSVKKYFDRRLQEAIDAGVLEDGVENYIHRMYEKESPLKQSILAELRSGIFTGRPALAKQRVFQYDFEAEKAGLKPEKSFIKRIAAYDLALNKAIADRAAVKAMMEIKKSDGRPMIDVGGIGSPIKDGDGATAATLIKPTFKPEDVDNPENHRGDYLSRDFPALRKWKWVAKDSEGKPIFVQGDVLVHPEAVKDVDALFNRSAIRANPLGNAALKVSSTIKQTMLDLSGFHFVQITVHGWEHRTFKPVGEIDFNDPYQVGLIRGGLVVGETTGQSMFSEGLAGSSLTKFIPKIGPRLQELNHWLFNDYIPRLKMATGLHALERNKAKYPDLSMDELYHMTANQMNAAFGELNYEMMARSKTAQDAMRLTLLAPDFLEARSKFVAQAATKYGAEQRTALLVGAAALYVTARILNKVLDDQYHFEPRNAFNVVYGGKAYTLRTIQGDLIHLASNRMQFLSHRLNPITTRPLLEAVFGRDSFGRTRDTAQQVGDFAKTAIPISLKGLAGQREQSLAESLMNAFGFSEHRESPATEIYKLADDWKKANKVKTAPGEFIYDPDKDPYRAVRNAALYYGVDATKKEIESAVEKGDVTKEQIIDHFTKSASRPFTGSDANETKFRKSLSEDDKKKYEEAKQERIQLMNTVRRAAATSRSVPTKRTKE